MQKNWFNNIFTASLLLLALWACNSQRTVDPSTIGWSYTPLSVNMYWIYDVHSIMYNDFTTYEERNFESRVLVTGSGQNQLGDDLFYLQRHHRNNASESWQLDSAWQVKRTLYQYTETANNQEKLILTYPLNENNTWNSNNLNTREEWLWKLIDVNGTYTVENLSWDNTITIEQRNIDDPIVESDIRYRVYQQNVGEVYRLVDNREHCYGNEPCDPVAQEKSIEYQEIILKESGILAE